MNLCNSGMLEQLSLLLSEHCHLLVAATAFLCKLVSECLLISVHPSLPLYLPADSINKTRINVRVSWAGLINSEQELSPNSPNI